MGCCGVATLQMKVGHMDGMHCFIDTTSILVRIKSVSLYNCRTVYQNYMVTGYEGSKVPRSEVNESASGSYTSGLLFDFQSMLPVFVERCQIKCSRNSAKGIIFCIQGFLWHIS